MDYCWQGLIWLFVGALLGIIGIWSLQSDKKKYLREGVRHIIVGAVAVTCAGLLMTYGWNRIGLGKQRNNLIRAFAQELYMNVLRLEGPPIKSEVYYRKENVDVVLRPFPTLKTTALNAVMSSGLWDLGKQTERNFLYTIADYEIAIGNANRFFDKHNNILTFEIGDPNKVIAQAKEYQRVTPEKDYFRSLDGVQNEVIKLLLSKHKWAIPLKEREVLLQRIREKPPVNKTEDVNKPEETLPQN